MTAHSDGTCHAVVGHLSEAEARAYLAAIVECSEDAILSKDLNGIIRSCNATAERLFGYRAEELIGRPVQMLIPLERKGEEDLILSRIRAGERIAHFETVRVAKDGRKIDISLTVSPVRDASGTTIGVSKIARDITAQRRAERALAQLRHQNDLDRQAAAMDRERLLEGERLARADAERASRLKDEFVAMVSHELRTPLNAILGWTQLMTRAQDDATLIARGIDVIARNTRVQAQLISDLLDVSRIAAGKLRLDIQSVTLSSVIRDAVETVEREAAAKAIRISTTIDDRVGPVAGDATRLQQVLWNLLTNAIKFSPDGGPVAVSLEGRDGTAIIAVRDSGAGIRPDVLPHVFEAFHQADRSITRRFGGLGLGLAIVKHLVDLHGGTVQAESAGEGRGATLTLRLPVATVPAEPGRAPTAPPALDTWMVTDRRSLDVLLVEDDPDARDYLTQLLQAHGAIVRAASTVPEALRLFREQRPDLLISDIGLPDMDGYDLIEQIRREAPRRVPAIALTAYFGPEDRTRALVAGYDAHLAKPAEPAELLATITSLVQLIGRRPVA